MQTKNDFSKILQELFEELLEEDNLEAALAGSLEILARALKSEAGVIWLLDRDTNRMVPMFHMGPIDLSNFSVELANTAEGFVTKTGESLLFSADAGDDRWEGNLLTENGLKVSTGVCVPLNNLHEVVGCLEIVNKKDGTDYTPDEMKLCQRLAAMAALTIDEKGLKVNAGEKKDVLISLRGVTKEYPSGDGKITVLKGIDLDIYKGEFLVILGESGCGKSTLVNIIGGMDNLTDGTLLVDGKDYSHPTDRELTEYRREYMGFVFQSYNLMPNLTAQATTRRPSPAASSSVSPSPARLSSARRSSLPTSRPPRWTTRPASRSCPCSRRS